MRILSFDPGETTGYAEGLLENNRLTVGLVGSWRGLDEYLGTATALFAIRRVDVVVVEDYVVYPHKLKEHIGNALYTAREIGRLEFYAYVAGANLIKQSASMAKQRWTDERLTRALAAHYFTNRHAIDAIRHLLTYVERRQLAQLPFTGKVL